MKPMDFASSVPAQMLEARAYAFDRRHASKRPLWQTSFSFHREGDVVLCERRTVGFDQALICEESASYSLKEGFVTQARSYHPYLDEQAALTVRRVDEGRYEAQYDLAVQGAVSRRVEQVFAPLIPVSAMPIYAVHHRDALRRQGAQIIRYPVLKVKRSAAIRIKIGETSGCSEVLATPTNLLLRALFGTTSFRFDAGMDLFQSYNGVLDPRDRRRNGRWFEYRGSIELPEGLALARIVHG